MLTDNDMVALQEATLKLFDATTPLLGANGMLNKVADAMNGLFNKGMLKTFLEFLGAGGLLGTNNILQFFNMLFDVDKKLLNFKGTITINNDTKPSEIEDAYGSANFGLEPVKALQDANQFATEGDH
ncbi:hypothetical protein Zmor_011992 [Zophobas morio]|uniref:Uncharacterized protein n=1 Tax=Zophobas morio TaxID=2755281 RepID=A0AA38HH30_9CUCU|nr:hypothetical protein Zmor_011992 [Zophobas morio]